MDGIYIENHPEHRHDIRSSNCEIIITCSYKTWQSSIVTEPSFCKDFRLHISMSTFTYRKRLNNSPPTTSEAAPPVTFPYFCFSGFLKQ